MATYTIYSLSTGEVLRSGESPEGDTTPRMLEGEGEVAGLYRRSTHYVANGEPVAYTDEQRAAKLARPCARATWSNTTMSWTDHRTLDDVKAARWEAIKVAAAAADVANITVQTVTFKADAETRAELIQEALLAHMAIADGITYSLAWERANGNDITLTAAQVKGLVRAINSRTAQIRAAAKEKRAAIEAATTRAEIAAVVW